VRDFDGERLKLSHRKRRPTKLRSRYVVLDEDGIRFFMSQIKNKLPLAWIFSMGAKPWRRGGGVSLSSIYWRRA
jgi:hypothetical protein